MGLSMAWWPFGRRQEVARKGAELTLDALRDRVLLMRGTAAGEVITPVTALRSPTVHAVVNLVGRTVSHLPIDVVEIDGDNRHPRRDHFVAKLLNQRPNTWQSAPLYKQMMANHVLLWGNFYAQKKQARNGRIFALNPTSDPDAVTVHQREDWSLAYRLDTMQGISAELEASQVHHIRGLSLDGITGIRPVDLLRETIALEIAAEKFGAELFGSGNIPTGVLHFPARPSSQEEESRLKAAWESAFGKKRGTAVLYGQGAEFKPIQMNAEESQFLETRKLQREIIAGAMGIPPPAVGILERATFNNVSELGRWLVTYMLAPFLVNIEQQVWYDLIPESEKGSHQVKFNLKGLLRGDMKSRSEALKVMREQGIINADEWRALEDMNPIASGKGGDVYLQPMNMHELGKPPEKAESPPPQDKPPEGPTDED